MNKKILLLVNNISVHIIKNSLLLINIIVHYLLPNIIIYLQPANAGIINSFKIYIFIIIF